MALVMYGRTFCPRVRSYTGLHDLNQQVRLWLDTVANCRIHGTTHKVPTNRLVNEALNPANPFPFHSEERHIRKVSSDTLVLPEQSLLRSVWLCRPSRTCSG